MDVLKYIKFIEESFRLVSKAVILWIDQRKQDCMFL